ncbi:MAG: YbgC/FadM family acyl-CoA thioesterase [Deltaproteobacteria bacterium]|nr:YbgC/FadM family acyl-CoA thioesterase [Deltaproteobacteria bacterium]
MLPIRIYYEDTDCGGVVYYANYLRYFERGRTEFLRDRGISLTDCHDDKGIVFVVAKAEIEYLSPGRHNDLLLLDTQLTDISGVKITFSHTIRREGSEKELVRGIVTLASVNKEGRPVRIPEDIKARLKMIHS